MNSARQPFDWFDRLIVPVLSYLAAATLFGLMMVTCVDVVARYILNTPITGSFEITEILLAALIFAGLPLVTLKGDHVTVDLFDTITPNWLFRIQHIFACAISVVCTAFLSYRLWIRAENMYAAGETTAELKFTVAWLTYSMSLLMALSACALLILVFRSPQRHIPGESEGSGA
ncbi:MAG: TRAP transporter small permease [Betaproteobacteria bacterium]|nr:TRAP transporter small permease [Betaproteobacteria bacterium]